VWDNRAVQFTENSAHYRYEVTIEGKVRECVAKKYAFAGLLRLFLLDFTLSVGNVR
jgi:hypothetical protein